MASSLLVSTISPLPINTFGRTSILDKAHEPALSTKTVEAWQEPQRLLAVRCVPSRTREARADE